MSEQRGEPHDPAERLAAALRRIAVAIERRDAALERPAVNPSAIPAVARDLDGLIARLRAVLDEMAGPESETARFGRPAE